MRFETVAGTYATLCTCRRLQLNKMPGYNVLCCAEHGQGRFNAVSAFSPFVPNFSIVPSRQEKKLVCPEKNGTEPWQNLVAGAGPLGWSRQGGQLRDGGPGRDGGRSRAAREILDFFLNVQDFFRGKNLAILREKSGTTTCSYVLLRRSYHFNYAAFMYGLFLNITISKDCRPMA